MEKDLDKERDFVIQGDLSSQTEVTSLSKLLSSESEKGKRRKKKKGCTCKGFESDDISERSQKKKKSQISEWFRRQKMWAEHIRGQRRDLKTVGPVIDDKPPKLLMQAIYDTETLNCIWHQLKAAFEMNKTILKSLHEINLSRGETDTFKFNYSTVSPSNYAERRAWAKEIEKQNKTLSDMFKNPMVRIKTAKEHAEEWQKHEAIVESSSQFPLWYKVKKEKEKEEVLPPPAPYFKQHVTEKSAKYPDKRPRVFLEIAIKNVGVVGKMIVMLYSDYVPMTVKNFLAFCNPKAELTYKGNFFYLIFQDYYCQTGDVVENKGFGGTSIYGPYFGNEDFTLKHADRGYLTMYQKILNRNASQFLITFRKLESLDGQNVVFGKIIRGFHVLEAIESVGSKKTGRPKVEIYISDCDEI